MFMIMISTTLSNPPLVCSALSASFYIALGFLFICHTCWLAGWCGVIGERDNDMSLCGSFPYFQRTLAQLFFCDLHFYDGPMRQFSIAARSTWNICKRRKMREKWRVVVVCFHIGASTNTHTEKKRKEKSEYPSYSCQKNKKKRPRRGKETSNQLAMTVSSSSIFWGRIGPESGILWSGNGHGRSRTHPIMFLFLHTHHRIIYCSKNSTNTIAGDYTTTTTTTLLLLLLLDFLGSTRRIANKYPSSYTHIRSMDDIKKKTKIFSLPLHPR
jgi:hypothetical protein